MELVSIVSQYGDSTVFELWRINKHTASVVVTVEFRGNRTSLELILVDFKLYGSGTPLTAIYESFECQPSAGAGIKSKLSLADDFQSFVALLEIAKLAPIIGTGAKPEVRPASRNVLSDPAVAFPIQSLTIAQVSTSREDQECTRGCPRFFEDGITVNGHDSIIWRKQPPQTIDTMLDRFDCTTIAYDDCDSSVRI